MAGPLAGKWRNTNVGFMLHAGVTRYEMVYKKGQNYYEFLNRKNSDFTQSNWSKNITLNSKQRLFSINVNEIVFQIFLQQYV